MQVGNGQGNCGYLVVWEIPNGYLNDHGEFTGSGLLFNINFYALALRLRSGQMPRTLDEFQHPVQLMLRLQLLIKFGYMEDTTTRTYHNCA